MRWDGADTDEAAPDSGVVARRPPYSAGGAARPPWDFGYAPLPAAAADDDGGPLDLIVALRRPVPAARLAAALAGIAPGAAVDPLLERAPIYWYRARSAAVARRAGVEAALAAAGIPARYVASCRRPSAAVAPRLDLGADRAALPRAPAGWAARPRSRGVDLATPGRWFLRAEEGGVAVDRRRSGGGAGTRLAVIDDDAAESAGLEIDREVLVLLDRPPRSHPHGALMIAWAVGTGQRRGDFRGVAPDASPRLYLIPKPGASVVALPLAIALAALDGADVILCAAYVEGSTSPMLDDALELAWRAGRRGRGALVVLPTGREASSPDGSLHASFSLGFGEPASDPRVVCVGPSGRPDGWFLWRDRRGRSRPFANRGPAVRWLAPGDDMAYPLQPGGGIAPASERLYHAESSGASAVAAGALLLVLAQNPALRAREVDALVTSALDPLDPGSPPRGAPFADAHDLLPCAADRDGHNAKHGYGRLNAARACLAAGDPIAMALIALGDDAAARAWFDARRADPRARALYSRRLGRWAVRALLADETLFHGVRALLRHARLIAGRDARRRAHGRGAALRQVALLLRALAAADAGPRPGPRVAAEIASLRERVERLSCAAPVAVEEAEDVLAALAARVFQRAAGALGSPDAGPGETARATA